MFLQKLAKKIGKVVTIIFRWLYARKMVALDLLSIYIFVVVWQNLGFWKAVLVAIIYVTIFIARRWDQYVMTCHSVADLLEMYINKRKKKREEKNNETKIVTKNISDTQEKELNAKN